MTADINRLLDEYRDACVAYKENCDALSVATEARKWRDAARAAIIAAWEGREDARDAARYRWLANHIEHPEMFWVQWALTKECIDAQIDEAIKLFPHGFKKPSLNGYKND